MDEGQTRSISLQASGVGTNILVKDTCVTFDIHLWVDLSRCWEVEGLEPKLKITDVLGRLRQVYMFSKDVFLMSNFGLGSGWL